MEDLTVQASLPIWAIVLATIPVYLLCGALTGRICWKLWFKEACKHSWDNDGIGFLMFFCVVAWPAVPLVALLIYMGIWLYTGISYIIFS